MPQAHKTVLVSYRRTNVSWALAIFQHLTHHGFDVFERVILENIRSRAHFPPATLPTSTPPQIKGPPIPLSAGPTLPKLRYPYLYLNAPRPAVSASHPPPAPASAAVG